MQDRKKTSKRRPNRESNYCRLGLELLEDRRMLDHHPFTPNPSFHEFFMRDKFLGRVTKESFPVFAVNDPGDRDGGSVVRFLYAFAEDPRLPLGSDFRDVSKAFSDPTTIFGPFLRDGNWTLYVMAQDDDNSVSGTQPFSFQVDTMAPGLPTVDLLSADDTGQSDSDNITAFSNVRLKFASTGDVTKYQYQINGTPIDSSSAISVPVGQSATVSLSLVSNIENSVWVRAFDSVGNMSHLTQFIVRVDAEAPTAPTLESPEDRASVSSSPTLSWEMGSDLWKYQVKLTNNKAGMIESEELLTTSWNPQITDGTWSWQVRARDVAGNLGLYGPVRTFSTNTAPIANFAAITPIDEGGTLALDASASKDDDGDKLSYSWDLNGDGDFSDVPGSNSTPTLTWNDLEDLGIHNDGSYRITVKVSDGTDDSKASRDLVIGNLPPVIDELTFTGDAKEGSLITFTALASDPAGEQELLTYEFDFNNDGKFDVSSSNGIATHAFDDNGEYAVSVRVSDDRQARDDFAGDKFTIANVPPSADPGSSQTITEPNPVVLTGRGTDPGPIDAKDLDYHWIIEDSDGNLVGESREDSIDFKPMKNGTFTAIFTVADKDQATDSKSITLTVDLRSTISGYILTKGWRDYGPLYGGQNHTFLTPSSVKRGVVITNNEPGTQNITRRLYLSEDDGLAVFRAGAFRFDDLPPGTYTLEAFSYTGEGLVVEDNRFSRATASVTVIGNDPSPINLTIQASSQLVDFGTDVIEGRDILSGLVLFGSVYAAVGKAVTAGITAAVLEFYKPSLASIIADVLQQPDRPVSYDEGTLLGSLIEIDWRAIAAYNPQTDQVETIIESDVRWTGPTFGILGRRKASSDDQTIWRARSPVSLAIEDPEGKRSGVDARNPADVQEFNDIPGVIYHVDELSHVTTLAITRDAIFSNYTLFVFGLDDGSYALDVEAFRNSGVSVLNVEHQSISKGQVDVYGVFFPRFVGDRSAELGTGHISGQAWWDLNNDGRQDVDEPLLVNRSVFIDSNANGQLDSGEPTAKTNESGSYAFSGLAAGMYEVRQMLGPGLAHSFPASSSHVVAIARGASLSFDGVDDLVLIRDDDDALRMSDAFTIEAWIHPTGPGSDPVNGGVIVNKEGEYAIARFPDGTIRWAVAAEDPPVVVWINTGVVAPVDEWTHVAVTFDEGRITTYVNGSAVHSRTVVGQIGDYYPDLNDFQIGGRQFSNQDFKGKIDEVRVWRRGLSEVEIQMQLRKSLTGNEQGLVGYWPFDEGAGAISSDIAGGDHPALLGVDDTGVPISTLVSENFDALPDGTTLSDQNLPGWKVVEPNLRVSSGRAASTPNGLHGNDSNQRGAMFHQVQRATDLQFRFFRKANANNENGGDNVEVGFTQTDLVDPQYKSLTGSRVMFSTDARKDDPDSISFKVLGADHTVISDLRLAGELTDGIWYDGFIRLESDNTATFGYKPVGESEYKVSPGHQLPPGFQANYVGVTAFTTPQAFRDETFGHAALDDIVALQVPNSKPGWVIGVGSAFTDVDFGVSLPGDYDRNGTVDEQDYPVWESNFGIGVAPGTSADGNRDGQVDGADYLVWRNNVGATIHTGELKGKVFEDLNANGILDSGENGLAGRLIFLDKNGNGELDFAENSTTTSSNGDYEFTGLPAGEYAAALRSLDSVQTSPRDLGPEFAVFATSSSVLDDTLNGGHSAANNRGDTVVTWVDRDFVFARRVGPDGQPKREALVVSSNTSRNAGPRVAVAEDGGFLVTWHGREPGSNNLDIFGRLFSAEGADRGLRFKVNAPSTVDQVAAAAAMWANGEFVVVYGDEIANQPGHSVFAQLFLADGTKVGPELVIDSLPAGHHQGSPVVAINPATDGFVVSWSSASPDLSDWKIFARMYDRNGNPLGDKLPAHAPDSGGRGSKIAFDASGNWDLVWNANEVAEDVVGQRFNSDGAKIGDKYTVNQSLSGEQHVGPQALAVDQYGNLVAIWQDIPTGNIVGRRFHRADGNTDASDDFIIGNGSNASVSVDAAGNIFVSWLRSGEGVIARRLSPTFNKLFHEVHLVEGGSISGLDFGQMFGAADYNRDGRINTADYDVWRADFGSTTNLAADGNRDGKVDAADYVFWRQAYAERPRDYGDAPDPAPGTGLGNYNTLSTDNGPSHVIVPWLQMVGSDDDGLSNPIADLVLTVGAQPSVNVRVTNSTGTAATLFGWIDYNANGVFDNTTERASVGVPNGTFNAIKSVVFPVVPGGFTGTTYARFRFSTDVAAANPTGAAGDGEVEDYQVTITMPSDGTADSAKTNKIASSTGGGPILANEDLFGRSVASIGDLDGDGVGDLAVAAYGDDTGGSNRGAVYVLFMNANGTVKSEQKIADGIAGGPTLANDDYFGNSVALLGDLDGDGVADVAVGATGDDTGGRNRGAVYVVLLNPDGTTKSSQKIASGTGGGPNLADNDYFGASYFGASVASLGDVDGDGVTDLAVGAPDDNTGGSNRGAVYVLLLNPNGTAKSSQKIASGTGGGPNLADEDHFGFSVATLGDLDGDGVSDIAVGARGDDSGGSDRGAVYVLFMNANGSIKVYRKIASDTGGGPTLMDGDFFGISVASLPDLDADGVTDLAVGARDDDTGGSDRGAVQLLRMNADGTVKGHQKIASGTGGGPTLANSDLFGISIASRGDLDGDGIIELAIGAGRDDTGGSDRGAVYVLYLNPVRPDFGDAPDVAAGTGASNYNTLVSDNGPSHTIVAGLRMGASVHGDGGALQNAGANADDVNSALPDDEDGLVNPAADLVLTVGAQPTVNVRVTNSTGSPATLYGWIDYNNNGLFENATERASVAVPNGTTNSITTLLFPAVPSGFTGTTYARFRFSTDAAAANPTGAAMDGEVEDYAVTITKPSDGTADSAKTKKIAHNTNGGPTLVNIDGFGTSVTSIGDLDGDGISDFAAGANGDDTGGDDRGAVYVLFLNADGTVKSSEKIANGTGGGTTLTDDDYFGTSVASLGELDGDGVTDLVVGGHGDDTGGPRRGAVYVLLMNSNGTAKSSQKVASGIGGGPILPDRSFFGRSAVSLGDLDGDGITEIAVGAYGDPAGGSYRGAVHVLFMNADGTAKSSQKIASGTGGGPTVGDGDFFGHSVASLGDLDGDGITDLAVGAHYDDTGAMNSNRGAVYVLLMNANGTVKASQKIASGMVGAPDLESGNLFGSAVASLGDLDGDGVTDLAVGAVGDEEGGYRSGAVHLLFMNANGTAKASRKITSATNGGPTLTAGDNFGVAVATLGDLDGDGVLDLAVGAHGDNTGGSNSGAVYVLFLNPDVSVDLPGDYNLDESVDAADYSVWRNSFGMMVTPFSGADGSGNGTVDQDDYDVWRAQFGRTSPPSGATSGAVSATEEVDSIARNAFLELAGWPATDDAMRVEESSPLARTAARFSTDGSSLSTTALNESTANITEREKRVREQEAGIPAWRDKALLAWLSSMASSQREDDRVWLDDLPAISRAETSINWSREAHDHALDLLGHGSYRLPSCHMNM
jgi:hypothetical protein